MLIACYATRFDCRARRHDSPDGCNPGGLDPGLPKWEKSSRLPVRWSPGSRPGLAGRAHPPRPSGMRDRRCEVVR